MLSLASSLAWLDYYNPIYAFRNGFYDEAGNFTLFGFTGIVFTVAISAVIAFVLLLQLPTSEARRNAELALKKSKKQTELPPNTTVTRIFVYPVKSCRGIQLQSTRLKLTGLEFDRNWMFLDQNNKFLTIRNDPKMTLINTAISADSNSLTISIKGQSDSCVTIDTRPDKAWLGENCKLIDVDIWGQKTDAWNYPADTTAVFSDHFQKPVKLVYKGPKPRLASDNAAPDLYSKDAPHMFADDLPLQIASESSLKDLNRRYKEAYPDKDDLTISRFRPNILVQGRAEHPWEEDSWKRVRLTSVNHSAHLLWKLDLDVTNRCTRCQVSNVNPETAEKDDREPWDTLMKFRRIDPGRKAKYKPCFGMLCVPTKEGEVHVGAELQVLELTDKHEHGAAKFADM